MTAESFAFESSVREAVQFDWAGNSVVGKVRRINEDCFVCADGVFVVADGMGGHDAGDVASRIVVDRFIESIGQTPIPFAELERIVVAANADVRDEATASGHFGMGATLVAVVWVVHHGSPYLAVVNVGDSRCYLSDDDGFRCITHDHSLVQDLVDSGVISSDEAQTHPDRNVVTRAMGVDNDVVADYLLLPAFGQQRLLLCSDGVSGQLADDEVMRAMTRPDAPSDAVRAMIDAVMVGTALDNATAVVVDVIWAAERPESFDNIEITSPRPMHPSLFHEGSPRGLVRNTPADAPSEDARPSGPPLITSVPRAVLGRLPLATGPKRKW